MVAEQRKLDPLIDAALAQSWPLKRIEAVLRAILRAGAYELDKRGDIPARVIVSEYVDIAHAFVEKDQTGMVNAVLDHIAQAERGLYLLCDYGPYLAPYGQAEPLLTRRLRELAWTIKARPVTVLFVGPTFPELPELEKELKAIDLPSLVRSSSI